MQDYSQSAIEACLKANIAYCKFISPNDAGVTSTHQYGYLINRDAYKLAFAEPGEKGTTKEQLVTIKWQDDFETSSRFIYYGDKTRNEYRLTRVPRGVPFSEDDAVGNLLILAKFDEEYFQGYVLQSDDEIDAFLEYFAISPAEANGIIQTLSRVSTDTASLIQSYIEQLDNKFPATTELSAKAREIYNKINSTDAESIVSDPDSAISGWVEAEYSLFKEVEKKVYQKYISTKFSDVDSLVDVANTILNRRKSRAGKSLEHHLAAVFDTNNLPYTEQGITEGHKKPDFIIPSIELYHSLRSPDKLVFLGAKTTCKDRWRQVLNEADRIPVKHLFTLQPGVSSNQLNEMQENGVRLVVPAKNVGSFAPQDRDKLLTLKDFILSSKTKIT
jgi:type II restriction enzyme